MKEYVKTDQQLHWLCQILTKANRSFVPKKNDDSQTNLYYDSLGDRIVGRWIKSKNENFLLTLNISNLQIECLDSSYQPIKSFLIINKTMEEAEQEIESFLPEIGLNPKGFSDKLHYVIPDYPFSHEVIKQINKEYLKKWRYYRNLANRANELLLGYFQIEGEVRIWPHHFDTGIYIVSDNGMGIGFGLAMEDSLLNDPYFYMSGYSSNGSLAYKNLPDLMNGKWIISESWKGAVLPLSDLEKIPQPNQIETIEQFMLKTAKWFINQN